MCRKKLLKIIWLKIRREVEPQKLGANFENKAIQNQLLVFKFQYALEKKLEKLSDIKNFLNTSLIIHLSIFT